MSLLPLPRVASAVPAFDEGKAADDGINLDAIRQTRGNIKEIRCLLKGNLQTCYRLFREATEQEDAVTQIQLSYACWGIKLGKDQTKDFSSLHAGDLKEFHYYPDSKFIPFNTIYEEAMGEHLGWGETRNYRAIETFSRAADLGYLPAVLVLLYIQWFPNPFHYGFAVQLRPFVNQGDKILDFYFGQALKNGCQRGPLYYEGLYWMENSLGIPAMCPGGDESYEDFENEMVTHKYRSEVHYEKDGFIHIGNSIILTRSVKEWRSFVREKLTNVEIAPPGSYQFDYNPERIKFLLNEYNITTHDTTSFIEEPSKKRRAIKREGQPVYGFFVSILEIYKNHKRIGKISVQEDTYDIYETMTDPRIQELVEFIENIMTRSGSAMSAYYWLRQISEDSNHKFEI